MPETFDASGNFANWIAGPGEKGYDASVWSGVTKDNKQVIDYTKPIKVVGTLKPKQEVPKAPAAPKAIGAKQSQQVAFGGNRSPTTNDIEVDKTAAIDDIPGNTPADAINAQTDELKAQDARLRNARRGQAAGNFIVDVINARNEYQAISAQARLNIAQVRNQAADAVYRGRQAQVDAQSQGYQMGQDATLAMAAQGQDVTGAGVQKVQGSFEAMGIYNGMREEINGMREALGFELDEVSYDYQIDQAGINRDNKIIGSAINSGIAFGMA